MSETLFEVTKDHLETGLRGYPVGYCTTSSVDPQKGLFYVGRPLSAIYTWDPEEVIYLLYHGKKAEASELTSFKSELTQRQQVPKEVCDHILQLPTEGHAMSLFSCSLTMLGMYEKTKDYEQDCINLIAKLPHLVACIINHHAGWGETPIPDPSLGYMENFTQMLQVPGADKGKLLEIFRLFNILHYDHGGGNLSAFCGKAVASGLQHMFGSISAAMNALSGPRHGRANQDGLKFVQEAHDALKDDFTETKMEQFIKDRLSSKGLIYGFGHAVLRVEDPRATLFYDYADKHFPDHSLVKTAFMLRKVCTKVLAENPKISNPYPNIDAMSGTALSAAGFCYPEYFTPLFGLSRAVGIAIQIVYERCYAREGKGTPIVRPKYFYKER